MTTLGEKQVIPTPKYALRRWLSVAAAVLVLLLAVGGVWALYPQQPPVTDEVDGVAVSTAPSTTTTAATESTTLPTTASPSTTTTMESPSATIATDSTTATTTTAEETTVAETTTAATKDTTTTTATTTATATTTTTTTTTTTRTTTTTTTKKTTTTTTAPVPAYPASWDVPATFYTEDGQAFEDVGWTYQAAGNSLYVSNGKFGEYLTFTKSTLYNVPLSACVIVTGFTKPATNGCYRIPPVIDGKVVVGVDMRQPVDGAHQFNDADVADTVRVITFPPEMIVVFPYTFNKCTNIEHAYFTSAQLLMYPSAVPTQTGGNYTDSLAMHAYRTLMLYDPYASEYDILKDYCEYIVYPEEYIALGGRKHYPNTYWWLTDTDVFSQLYPDWFTDKHNAR